MVKTFQSYLQEDQLLTLVIGEEGTRRNHLNLQQRLFRQALKTSLNVLCQENLIPQAFTSEWFRCS